MNKKQYEMLNLIINELREEELKSEMKIITYGDLKETIQNIKTVAYRERYGNYITFASIRNVRTMGLNGDLDDKKLYLLLDNKHFEDVENYRQEKIKRFLNIAGFIISLFALGFSIFS